ncbi:very-long-chain (3R)-3-hydroxyacyl-CoA dehydratase hpo-8-like [Malaya genurostris]|uniref:very-long-chain (3R)-3-hydroxyacyl-CoA dehydratase hpo-8-like n=1 Tax=Malaya genurostris TaxID=325434 RepID=UPI0026F39969|nr:very-long-chain (3R)-3-hydroxyacyl-CoA dehydratase hpo-8-like [Malaya genurostris]
MNSSVIYVVHVGSSDRMFLQFKNRAFQCATMADPKKEQSATVKLYLILYNSIQFLGWFYIYIQFLMHYFVHGKTTETLWDRVGSVTYYFQLLCIFEFFHALFGLVPSNALITLMQVFGRCLVVVGAIDATPTGKLSPGLPIALFCWSLTETIRYSYYVLHLALPTVPGFMSWLRYTIFIPLYPLGFFGELLCFYWAQSYIGETDMWSVSMPNPYNFTFSFYYFVWIMAIGYLPMFPQMYLHMFSQRKKILGGERSQKVA